jgi:Na+-driven multidrug efflux pump
MTVSLYTSRVVLATLGADDFGLNAVVTSAVTIFYFLNSSMADATSRFLTFELGKGDKEKLEKTFSAALTIHIIIAFITLVLGETVGLWYMENKMIIPEGRMTAVRWIYQLSLASAMIIVTQVPYNAIVIAREKMNVYAYIEILRTCLMLGIVYLLVNGNFDKLILYAILTLSVSIIITLIYRVYCVKRFEECRYTFEWDKKVLYPIFSFSGWKLYETLSLSAKESGANIILNLFWAGANAAYGIALQVAGVVQRFCAGFLIASKPQVIKYYAEGKIKEMEALVINVTKFAFLLFFALSFPLMVEMNFILDVWLLDVPEYSTIFCQLFLLMLLINTLILSPTDAIEATGKIKKLVLIKSTMFLFVPVITYLYFKEGHGVVYISFIITIITYILNTVITLRVLHSIVKEFSISRYIKSVIITGILVSSITAMIPLYIHFSLPEGWLRLFLVLLSSTASTAISMYYIALDKQWRQRVLSFIIRKIKKIAKI